MGRTRRLTALVGLLLATPGSAAQSERSDSPYHPLIEAARSGDLDEVESLIAGGTDVRVRPRNGLTPLMWAAVRGHAEIATRLLEAGEDPLYGYDPEWTPMAMAAGQGHIEVVRALLRAKPSWQAEELTPALLAAARDGHPLGLIPELVSAAIDLDGDGNVDALIVDSCCSDPTTNEVCEYYCSTDWLRKAGAWIKCQSTGPA